MFNLEQATAAWRRQMLAAGVKAPVPLEELESHLREDIAALISAGQPEAQAFQRAVSRLGSPGAVRTEFNKIKCSSIRPVKIASLLWTGAVIGTAAFLLRGLFSGRFNLLLYTHILTVIAGYGAGFILGSFGICYVCYRSFRALSPLRRQSLDHAVHLFSRLALGFVIVGVVLGMVWSKQNWGRYWGWDPKEIGALCVGVWLIALMAMQRFGQVSDRVTMLICIGGNIIVSLAWFGAAIVAGNPGMHSYHWPLAVFLIINVCFLTMGFAPANETPES